MTLIMIQNTKMCSGNFIILGEFFSSTCLRSRQRLGTKTHLSHIHMYFVLMKNLFSPSIMEYTLHMPTNRLESLPPAPDTGFNCLSIDEQKILCRLMMEMRKKVQALQIQFCGNGLQDKFRPMNQMMSMLQSNESIFSSASDG